DHEIGAFVPAADILVGAKTREPVEQLASEAQRKPRQHDLGFDELFFDLELQALPAEADVVVRAFDIRAAEVDAEVDAAVGSGVAGEKADQECQGARASDHGAPASALNSGRSIAEPLWTRSSRPKP